MHKTIIVSIIASILFLSCSVNKVSTTKDSAANIQKSQNLFEGEIKYKFLLSEVEGKSDLEIEEELKQSTEMFGRHTTYYFKKGMMKSKIDGPYMKLTQYFNGGDSIVIVDDMNPKPTTVSASSEWNFQLDSFRIEKSAKKINNIMCDLITFNSGRFTWKYYYNDSYKISKDDYKAYTSCFWNVAAQEVGALPLRLEGKIPGMYVYMEAEEILARNLSDELFTNYTLE